MERLASRIGFWSAVLVTVFNVGSTLTGALSGLGLGLQGFMLGFPVVVLFVVLMAAVHYYAPEEKGILGLLGMAFAVVCATMLSINYYFLSRIEFHCFPVIGKTTSSTGFPFAPVLSPTILTFVKLGGKNPRGTPVRIGRRALVVRL